MTTRQTVTLTAAAAAAASAGLVVRRLQDAGGTGTAVDGDRKHCNRWRSVTVLLPAEQVMPAGLPPGPLAELGDLVDVQVRPAPADRGTELSARLRGPEPSGVHSAVGRATGEDPVQRIRTALRQSKQLLETGEILRVDPAPHGTRSGGIGSRVLEFATRHAGGEGLL